MINILKSKKHSKKGKIMKKIIASLVLLTSMVFAESINWHSNEQFNNDFVTKQITKPILYFILDTTCKYCADQQKDINSNEEFKKFVNEKYYNVMVFQDKETIPQELHVNITPSIYILNPETKMPLTPEPSEGAVDSNTLLDYFNKVSQAYDYYLKTKK